MTPQQAAEGLIELVTEEGRVLVDFRDRTAGDPDVEADVIRAMLDAGETDGDIYGAVQNYVDASGLAASFFLGRDELIIAIGSPADRPTRERVAASANPGRPERITAPILQGAVR